jgi:prepilin-type N-terminal cleavage/methylation domain-containing protein
MKRINAKGGFTLIELLVVIAIIGILSSIVLVSLNSARVKGTDTRALSDAQQMRTWLETQYNGSGYPVLNGANASCNAAANSNTNATFGSCVLGPDANATALNADANSASGNPIYISVNPNNAAYAIRAYQKSTSKYFCLDSTGATNQTDTGTNATVARCQ